MERRASADSAAETCWIVPSSTILVRMMYSPQKNVTISKYYAKVVPARVPLAPSTDRTTQLLTQATELALLLFIEHGHQPADARGVNREGARDQRPARIGQLDDLHAPIGFISRTPHQVRALEIVHDGGDIAATAQNLLADVALREWPQVVERFEDAQLAFSEAEFLLKRRQQRTLKRARAAHQLDEGVECPDFHFWPVI